MRRMMVGMSQGKLGEALDVTFQQIQKYEKGTNRIGASRLQQLARVLEVPPLSSSKARRPPTPASSRSPNPREAPMSSISFRRARDCN